MASARAGTTGSVNYYHLIMEIGEVMSEGLSHDCAKVLSKVQT